MTLKKVYLELTNKCNLNCTICYRQSWQTGPRDMDRELLRKVSRELREMGCVEEIILGGIGEPTYAPLFCEALEDLKGFKLALTTNGTLLGEGLLPEAVVRHVNLVMISIDGMEECFAKIRGTALEGVINNIKKINELKRKVGGQTPVVGIQFVVSRDNMAQIYPLIDLASQLEVENLVLSNLLPLVKENAGKILYTRNENKEIKTYFNKAVNYSFLKGIKLTLPQWELKTERRCGFIEDGTTFITAAGEVVPCYRLSHSYREFVLGREKAVLKHSFGDLSQQSIKEIWEGRDYREFRGRVAENKYPSCLDCDYADGCDLVNDTSGDCYTGSPSCSDCLWARKFILCP